MKKPKFFYFGVLAVTLMALSASLGPLAGITLAASTSPSSNSNLVVVARDMTVDSKCVITRNGVDEVCPSGTIVGDFFVTEAEAKAAGEDYLIPTGHAAKDNAAKDDLIRKETAKIRASSKTPSPKTLSAPVHPNGNTPCGNNIAGISWTPSNFDAPRPTVYTKIWYSLGGSTCDFAYVTQQTTTFDYSGTPAYVSFYSLGNPNDCSVQSSGGFQIQDCAGASPAANIPFTSYYNLSATRAINDHTTYICSGNGCGFFDHKSYGATRLN